MRTDSTHRRTTLLGLAAALALAAGATAAPLRVLCTTFPMYQLTRTVVQGRDGATVTLLLPAQLGCPHDYALTPQDLRRLSRADVVVVNGLGLEEFLGDRLREVNPKAALVDSSSGVKDVLQYAGDGDEHEADEDHDRHDADEHHGEAHEHQHAGTNPHLFASPRQAARLVVAIAAGLGKADPGSAALYDRNAQASAARLNALADDLAALGKTLRNNRIVTQHGVFDYLARDMGLEVAAVVQAHAGQEPSAAEMIALVRTIRERQAGAVFTEPQYPAQIGRTIAREAGIPVATLDPGASGPEDAPLDYYEQLMRRNAETLKAALGTR
jgi:ABC-type Zn uptake system ZnuABC Zn-binding protein ZnuA